jgi:ferredoxin
VECPWQKTAPYVKTLLLRIISLCEFVGIRKEQIIQTGVPLQGNKAESLTTYQVEGPLSRRDFLNIFQKEVVTTAVITASTAIPDLNLEQKTEDELFREKINTHPTNVKRERLLEVLSNFHCTMPVRIPSYNTPFGEIEVSSKCIGCNVCETLCPVGAIQRRDGNGTFALYFHPELCTNCQVCKVNCLPMALQVKEYFNLPLLKQREPVKLIEVGRSICKACQADFLYTGSEFCPLCQLKGQWQKTLACKRILEEDRYGR